jgi:dihydroorotate dehydrogenase (fumarate)
MDLTTRYMGLTLRSPLVVGASPLTQDVKNIAAMDKAGAGAIVFHSIFQEQLTQEALALNYYLEQGTERFAESLTYFPEVRSFKVGPEIYLDHIAAAKKATAVPIIGSLNCVSPSGWTDFAQQIQQAGADGLELNVYLIPTNPAIESAQIEQVYLDILQAVKSAVTIPVAIKLSPFFSSPAGMLQRLDQAGADGLVLFNRFYQPDIDLDEFEIRPRLVLSTSDELRLPMRWIAILCDKVKASLVATSGVHTGVDAAKLVLSGADGIQVVSALLKNGIGHLAKIRDEMAALLEEKGYESVREARGVLSQRTCGEPAAFERANYMKTLTSYVHPWPVV